jgi:hypothetical protein
MDVQDVGGVTTTEVCNITCVMCHFNGPWAPRKQGVLTVEEVRKYLESVPRGDTWFAGTGEFFMDPNALTHVRNAVALGHSPCILTNGLLLTPELQDTLLEIGVRRFAISCDEISPARYGKIRIGGDLQVLLDACAHFRRRKEQYPELQVCINVTMFRKTFLRQDEFIAFWRGKVDQLNFNAEYHDIFKFRNKLFEPEKRNDCHIKVYLLPTGQMAPCCAMTVYQHHHQVDWLPHIKDTTPQQALDHFKRLYADPDSPLGRLCQGCDWWIMWARDTEGKTPYPSQTAYLRCVNLNELPAAEVEEPAAPAEPLRDRIPLPLVRPAPVAEPTPAVAPDDRPGYLGQLLRKLYASIPWAARHSEPPRKAS